jgi:excisionase family DNA binding protein
MSNTQDKRRRMFEERVRSSLVEQSPHPVNNHLVVPERPTMTIVEVAWALGISNQHAYRRAKAGEIPGAFRFGRRWVVSREAFNRFLSSPS